LRAPDRRDERPTTAPVDGAMGDGGMDDGGVVVVGDGGVAVTVAATRW
jgi:hypothetical protein